MDEEIKEFKAMNLQQLADFYKISRTTMLRWIRKISDPENVLQKKGYIFSPKQVRFIRSHLD